MATTSTAGLTTQAHELVKQHLTYDGSGRCTAIYTVVFNAADGAPCTKVSYQYLSGTSTQVTGMKETNDTWQAAWDF